MEFIKYNIKNIIWDFDGVIINSIPTKTEAFAYIFRDFPYKEVQKLLQFHLDNGGLSRFEKIQFFFTDIVKQPLSSEQAQHYADEFSLFSLQNLLQKKFLIEDSYQFILSQYKNYNMHIASGAWEKELLTICKHHKIDKYFTSIHGSPTPKTIWVKYILETYGYQPKETCMIGDSIQDFNASQDNNIYYYGYNNPKIKPLADVYIEKLS